MNESELFVSFPQEFHHKINPSTLSYHNLKKEYIFIEEIENMYRVSIKLYKHEWKFGRTINAVGTRAAGECFHSFFEFSQTFTSVCITR